MTFDGNPSFRPFCQTSGLVLSLRVDFVLPLSQEEEQQEQQQNPSPKSIIIPSHTKLLKQFDGR